MNLSALRLIILFIASCSISRAQAVEPKTYQLQDTVVVIADRYEIPLKHEANSRSYFNESSIKEYTTHSALQVLDALLPSSFVFEKKIMGYGVGTDGGGAIQLRGVGGKPNTGVLVLINGHPDFMGMFGHPLPDVYGMDEIESVEVLSGPSSTVFGSNAMGGVINLKLKKDYSKLITMNLEGGSYGTYSMGLKLTKRIGKTGFSFSVNRKGSEGHLDQTTFQSTYYNAAVEHQINSTWNISTNIRYVPYRFDDPARTTDTKLLGTYGIINRGMGDLILANTGNDLRGSTQLYFNSGSHEFYNGFESKDFTYGFSTYQQYKFSPKFNLAVGGDYISYGGKQINTEHDYDLTTYGAYALGFYSPVENVAVKFGARLQHHSLDINKFSPVLGATYSPYNSLRLFVNYQTGFRTPTIRDLYLFPVSNEALTEEEMNSIEGGLEYFISNNASLKFTYYRNDVKNLILPTPNPTPPPPIKYQNSGDAIQNGIETSFSVIILEGLTARASYSYLDSGDLTAFNPKHQFKYLLDYTYKEFSIGLFGKYIDGLYIDNYTRARLPDYNLTNISTSYSFGNYQIHLKVNNVLNREYYILNDYLAPGRYFIAGIDFSL